MIFNHYVLVSERTFASTSTSISSSGKSTKSDKSSKTTADSSFNFQIEGQTISNERKSRTSK